MNTLQKFEAKTLAQTVGKKKLPDFAPGDTLKVNVLIREGSGQEARERVQAYEGVCIGRSGHGINESFTVRKISYGEGVERVFPLYSPRIESVELVRRGSVRRAKLYYLRDRRGKAARIAELTTGIAAKDDKEAMAAALAEAKAASTATKLEKKPKKAK